MENKMTTKLQSVFLYGDITIDELGTVQDSELKLQKNNSDWYSKYILVGKALKNISSHLV